jgi:glycerophosphoryl diester phosphodiesterase
LVAFATQHAEAGRLALLEGVPVDPTSFAVDARATHVGLAMDSITKPFVKSLSDGGFLVFVYTANDPRDVATCVDFGVHGIISDVPDRI